MFWSKWAKLSSLCYKALVKVIRAFLCYKVLVKVNKAFFFVLQSFGQSDQSFFLLHSFGQSEQGILPCATKLCSKWAELPCATKLWSKWAKHSSLCYKALVKVSGAFFLVLQSFGQSEQSILPCATKLWSKWAKLFSWSGYAAVLWSKWAKLCPCVEVLWWGWAGLCSNAAILHSKWIKLCPCGAAFAVALAKRSKTLSACYCAEKGELGVGGLSSVPDLQSATLSSESKAFKLYAAVLLAVLSKASNLCYNGFGALVHARPSFGFVNTSLSLSLSLSHTHTHTHTHTHKTPPQEH